MEGGEEEEVEVMHYLLIGFFRFLKKIIFGFLFLIEKTLCAFLVEDEDD